MKVSFSITVKRGKKTEKWSDNVTDEGNDAYPQEELLIRTARELKKWLLEIEEKFPEIKNQDHSLEDFF